MPVHVGDFNTGLDKMRKTISGLPVQLGATAENFFRSNFRVQGWQGDNGVEPWLKRKGDSSSRWILVGKGTAHLMKGIRKFVSGNNIVVKVTGIATRYADIHNFGGVIKIPVTAKLRKFAWAMHYKTGKDMWKGMALTKKSMLTIYIHTKCWLSCRFYMFLEYNLR